VDDKESHGRYALDNGCDIAQALCCVLTVQHLCIILPIESSRHVEDSVQINKVYLSVK